jgi:hypothetical protein
METGTSFKKGKKPGPGRPKGLANKATINAREAIAAFVDGNAHRCQEWLEAIAVLEGPVAAFKCYMDLIEYHVPKLARTEISTDPNNPIKIELGWRQ